MPDLNYFKELFRVSKNQIICGGNYFKLPPTRCFVAWDKEQSFPNFSQVEFIWTSFDSPSKLFRRNNSYKAPGKIHPTQKPKELYTFLLKMYAKNGYKIIDTHIGSMSIACSIVEANNFDKMDLTLVGSEIDKSYFDSGIERLEQFKRQTTIFDFTE